jgi:hypothetical protein
MTNGLWPGWFGAIARKSGGRVAKSVAKPRDFKGLFEQCEGHGDKGGKGKEKS